MQSRRALHTTPPTLSLGQTNLSPFTYDLSYRRRHARSASSMSLLGFESDATTVVRVPRKSAGQREARYGGDMFYRDKGKGRSERIDEHKLEAGQQYARVDARTGIDTPRQFRVPQGPLGQASIPPNRAHVPVSPPRAYSPQPMSIDPRSAPFDPSSWPQRLQPDYPAHDKPYPADSHSIGHSNVADNHKAPFTKACHNILLIRHRQAARRRTLLLEYHRRIKADDDEQNERMQIDTPAVSTFAASEAAAPTGGNMSLHYVHNGYPQPVPFQAQATIPQVPIGTFGNPSSAPAAERHGIAFRNIADIATVRFNDGKPARKRRRDLSPESAYQPLATYSPLQHDDGPSQLGSRCIPGGSSLVAISHPPSSSSLLSPFQMHTPPSPPLKCHIPYISGVRTGPMADAGGGTGPSVIHGRFGFERDRSEALDLRMLEEVKDARRDAWLEEAGSRRDRQVKGYKRGGGDMRV
jgi:hypothetical protein